MGALPEWSNFSTPQPSQGHSQPPSSILQPTPQVVNVQRPSRNQRPVDRICDVLQTQDEAQAYLDSRLEAQQNTETLTVQVPQPHANDIPPTALFAHLSGVCDIKEMLFAGMAYFSLNNHNQPQTYAEAMAGTREPHKYIFANMNIPILAFARVFVLKRV